MAYEPLFADDPTSGREKIIAAVYTVITEEGYDSVSIQRVADEAGLSKATVYHHFDDKADLMLAFHEAVLSQIGKRLTQFSITDPIERLRASVDRFVLGRITDNAVDNTPVEVGSGDLGQRDPLRAFVEIRAQAVHDAENRARVSNIDRTIRDELVETIRAGIEDDVFQVGDVERAADRLYTLMLGGLLRRVTTDDTDLESIRDDTYEFIDDLRVE